MQGFFKLQRKTRGIPSFAGQETSATEDNRFCLLFAYLWGW